MDRVEYLRRSLNGDQNGIIVDRRTIKESADEIERLRGILHEVRSFVNRYTSEFGYTQSSITLNKDDAIIIRDVIAKDLQPLLER